MPDLPDLTTLRLCSAISNLAFCGVFAGLWLGNRRERHLLYWAIGALLYDFVILSFEVLAPSIVTYALLYTALSASTVIVLVGVRSFDGASPVRPWMIALVVGSGCVGAVPAALDGLGSIAARLGWTLGVVATVSAVGGCLLFCPAAKPTAGRRIAGAAYLAYLPSLGVALAVAILGGSQRLAALIPMLSDQLLLAVLNLGLLAMPMEWAEARLRDVALRDPLTGAWNRAGLVQLARSWLRPGTVVILLDVDHFKTINDRHGHAAGDRILVALAGDVSSLAPEPHAFLIRLGGDEFVMILPDLPLPEACLLADEIRHLTRQGSDLPARTVSLGIARVEPGETDFAAAIDRADRSLYRAKAEGRDRSAA